MPVSTPIPMTVTVRGTPVRFESSMTDTEAATVCRGLRSDFAAKLVQQLDSGRRLSHVQTAWLHKLAVDAGAPRPAGVDADLSGLIALFDTAANRLKFPKITVDVDGRVLVLSRCSPRSQYAGAVNVTGEGGYSERPWFGRVARDGSLVAGRQITDDVRESLRKLSADPVAFAREHGRKTGRCCFCNQALTDARSTEHGYGPVCAKSYGLPWSTGTARAAAVQNDADARERAEMIRPAADFDAVQRTVDALLVQAGGDPSRAHEIAEQRAGDARAGGAMEGARVFLNAAALIDQMRIDAANSERERETEARGFASDPDFRAFSAGRRNRSAFSLFLGR